ncbi:YciI-like protein [Erythrobacter sp. LQ02-29]|uniref:YciI-like protein n=1 Tax=Erythrobacter sp. LQ02-29 TaxID=2920384 RepID=UPI001F4D8EA6|nr:YciI-like protein [Erythrobacter sp. LQ02-29]MCP9221315.1 YciI-like protein [Erythrobacter sp. LQ02-29]
MGHYLLTYALSPDYLARRAAFRDEHLALAWEAAERGELLLGGATDPADQALLLFTGDGPEAAERFASSDPYVANGLVQDWRVVRWNTVVGETAATPVRSSA